MIQVIKANGQIEPFSEEKVINSINRAKIPEKIKDEVLSHVKSKIYNNIPTSEIYHHIIEFLGHSDKPYSRSRYSLKQSIMQLGPTGYPFEDFISKILESDGYKTRVRQILSGKCVSHEIDVIAEKNDKTAMIEAKFHNKMGTRSDVHVSMYTHARFLDIKEKNNLSDVWLVTNTKTTTDALTYAQCVGLKVISWSYPNDGSLRDLIEKSRLHPITMLSSLSEAHKEALLNNHVIMCKEIYNNKSLLDELQLSGDEKQKTIAEIEYICNSEK